jgi:hypothetical protein
MFNRATAVLLALITELVAVELTLLYLGTLLDHRMGWSGYAAAGGALFGFCLWVIHLLVALKSLTEASDDK